MCTALYSSIYCTVCITAKQEGSQHDLYSWQWRKREILQSCRGTPGEKNKKNKKHYDIVLLWNAQCWFLSAGRSGASGDVMLCSNAKAAAFLLELTSHVSTNKRLSEEKIPVSTDTGSGFATFFFFLQAVAKTAGHQNLQSAQSTWKASQQQHSRGSQGLNFYSYPRLQAFLNPTHRPLGDFQEKRQYSNAYIRMMFIWNWQRSSSRYENYDCCLFGPKADMSIWSSYKSSLKVGWGSLTQRQSVKSRSRTDNHVGFLFHPCTY